MPAPPLRRLIPWLLAALLAPPAPVAAAPFDPHALFGRLRGFLSAIWGDLGCELEPGGRCAPASRPIGCEIDPMGMCAPVTRPSGCEIEPMGTCAPFLRDAGCEIEPDGRCRN